MLRVTIAIAVLVLDPVGAFSNGDFQYTDADMRKAVEGTWRLTIDGKATTFTLTQASAPQHSSSGWIRSAAACRTRSLIKSAAACGDLSKMPLDVHVTEGDLAFESAKFAVLGTTFEKNGWLDLYFEGGYVDAKVTKLGDAYQVNGAVAGKTVAPSLAHLSHE